MGAGLPVDEVILDLVQLGEGAVDAAIGSQHVVDLAGGHPVGDERELQGGLGFVLLQGPLARVLPDVPEVRPTAGRIVRVDVGAVRVQGRVGDGADAAFVRGPVDEVVRGHPEAIPVDGLEPALVASGLGGGHRAVDEMGLVVPGLEHGPDEREAAVPLVLEDGMAGLGHEGLVVRLALARAVRAAPGRDGDGGGEGDAGRTHREQREAGAHAQCSFQSHGVAPVRVMSCPRGWRALVFALSCLPGACGHGDTMESRQP